MINKVTIFIYVIGKDLSFIREMVTLNNFYRGTPNPNYLIVT